MKTLLYTMLICSFYHFSAKAQQKTDDFPIEGKPMPDFYFSDVQYYPKTNISLNDFYGKWLILDCWNRYCQTCIDKMPYIDSLQKAFASKNVVFMLVGYTGSKYTKKTDDKAIRELFERQKKERNLNLPIAYDSVLFERFKIWACPVLILIDPKGIVRGVTHRISATNLNELLSGKSTSFSRPYRRKQYATDD